MSKRQTDCLGRSVTIHYFSNGFMKSSGALWSVLLGRLYLCGMPLELKFSELQQRQLSKYQHIQAGLFNAVSIHTASGLVAKHPIRLLEQQFSASHKETISLIARGLISQLLFNVQSSKLPAPDKLRLFGLEISNCTMSSAVNWILSPHLQGAGSDCKIGFFVNVNSVNLAIKNPAFAKRINQSDKRFADGLGMRLAARQAGFFIKENVNGTDLLPRLCESAEKSGHSLFLLGAAPAVAQMAAENLCLKYPNLVIAGTAHGYFKPEQSLSIVNQINHSGADILLVAMGSPIQEQWLLDNKKRLTCRTALAVGGLLDFNAGTISRAPLWLRELGMEWVWRLIQEPRKKFTRYVIGNPLFIIRTYLFNQANKGC
jgi:N-acetylglucosaminyldiphosphoundecaprenol N-acetyl-beta-D-mannosaminyltransferase